MPQGGTSAIILAGGNSQRIYLPKPFLPFDSHLTFLEKLVNVYFGFGCERIIIVLNRNFFDNKILNKVINEKTILIPNEHSEYGRFYSLKLGADKLSNEEFCFFQNVDNPFVDSDLLDNLYSSRIEEGYVVPLYKEQRGHPVLIGKSIIQRIKSEHNLNLNIRIMLDDYRKAEVPAMNDKVLTNINTPEEYKRYFGKELKPISDTDEKHL